ncbi:MAG: hypothetical protein ACKN9S_01745 [Pirellula sp.]
MQPDTVNPQQESDDAIEGIMDNTGFRSSEGRSITIIPKGYAENRSYVRKLSSLLMLIFAAHLFLGGLFFYGWYFFEDRRFQTDAVHTIGTIDSWCTHTHRRGNSEYYVIDYQFKTESGELASGQDKISSGAYPYISRADLRPSKKDEIEIEYIKGRPKTSRIANLMRYQIVYFFSNLAMLLAGVLCASVYINTLPTKSRLRIYGGVLMLAGAAILMLMLYGSILLLLHRPMNELLIVLLLLTLASPIYGGLLWLGWSYIMQSRITFTDPQELLKLDLMPPCGDQVTIMQHTFMGADSAVLIDHQHGQVHFINCHVTSGFVTSIKPIYSAKISQLKIREESIFPRGGKTDIAHLKSPIGVTTFRMDLPGVHELLELLRNHR